MADTWFRFYNTAVNDPKVQRLDPVLFRFWVNVLCLASSNDGILPSLSDLKFSLRIEADAASDLLDKLVDAGLVDKRAGKFRPHNWEVRQFKSDGSTDRVKRFRKRFRSVSETLHETGPEQIHIQSRTEHINGSPSGFADFWSACPRKVGKGAAEKAFKIAVKTGENPTTLIEAMSKYTASQHGKDTTYIPHPSTWLNQKRWLDEDPGGVPVVTLTAEEIAANQDRADRIMRRGKYADWKE